MVKLLFQIDVMLPCCVLHELNLPYNVMVYEVVTALTKHQKVPFLCCQAWEYCVWQDVVHLELVLLVMLSASLTAPITLFVSSVSQFLQASDKACAPSV